MEQHVLSVSELADYLKIGKSKAFELVKKNGFPRLRLGRRILIPIEELEEWIKENITITE